ncbi:MAG: UvrB/UvrC motif-containing protein, partial [Spirochaetaceae bacterium]|nr:UvrB/UvrC motif-containing protein [Spirochaetaceae bacterium]
MSFDLTALLRDWPYDSDDSMRIVEAEDGRSVLQVRQPLGLEQYELDGRPDGERPFNRESVVAELDNRLVEYKEATGDDEGFELTHEDCTFMQSEGVLYYYRYLLLFQLNDFERVIRDTGHNLRICELLENYCADEEDRNAVLQFKPYIVRMNAMARAMRQIHDSDSDEARTILDHAVDEIQALEKIDSPAFQFERVRSVNYLRSARDQIADRPVDPKKKLEHQLRQAVDEENYERAAQIRDRIRGLS